MRFGIILAVGAIALWTLAANAFAQEISPREQFQAAVAAYQKTSNDSSAIKVIQLYNRLDPLPRVPAEARESFAMGITAFKKSNNQAGFEKAVELFGKAIQAAPWWSEARYNRAIVLETLGQLVPALRDLNIYLAFNLTDTDRSETQDKVRELKAKTEGTRARQSLDRQSGSSSRPGGLTGNDGQSDPGNKRY